MKMSDLRAKARAIFGSAVAEPMPNQPNGAKALQQRANARPIPTYKVGGVVKKADGGMMKPKPSVKISTAERKMKDALTMKSSPSVKVSAAERKMGDALMMMPKGKEIMAAQAKRDAEKERMGMAKRELADRLLGIPKKKDGGVMADRIAARMAAGNYKKGGKVQTSSDTARKLATEMGGMKKGGKAKDGLAVMIAIGEAKKPVKKAVGGAGKTRKGMAPIKKAQGGAAKVRKGMMSPTGDIKQVVSPKKGIGGM